MAQLKYNYTQTAVLIPYDTSELKINNDKFIVCLKTNLLFWCKCATRICAFNH